MKNNKLTKYFLYTIGEILLIVVGILIALRINNWNENNNQQREIRDYLSIIKNDIQTDVRLAEEIKNFRDSSQYYSRKFFAIIKDEDLGIRNLKDVFNPTFNPLAAKFLTANEGYAE